MVLALGIAGVAIVELFRPGGSITATQSKSTGAPVSESFTPPTSVTLTSPTGATPSASTTPTGEAALGGNPILQTGGMAKQNCNPVGWPSSAQAAEAFYASGLSCLEIGWQPLFFRANLDFETPDVLVPTGTTTSTPCGKEDTSGAGNEAFYCPTNQTLYMPLNGMSAERYGSQSIIYLSAFAHEFGHHVQEITGILQENYREQRKAGGYDSVAGLELNRRMELQAQCFSGLFISSVVDSGGAFAGGDFEAAREDAYRGDHPGTRHDHGSPEHGQIWWARGSQDQIALCNTWTAPAAEVS